MSEPERQAIHDTARAVAAALGPQWSGERESEGLCFWTTITNGAISLHFNSSTPTQWRVSPNWPRDSKNQVYKPYRDYVDGINVVKTKTPAQIAADIKRRLITPFVPQLEAELAHIEEAEKFYKNQDAVTERLATIAGFKPNPKGDGHHSGYCGEKRIELYVGRTVNIKVDSLSPEQAERVLAIIAGTEDPAITALKKIRGMGYNSQAARATDTVLACIRVAEEAIPASTDEQGMEARHTLIAAAPDLLELCKYVRNYARLADLSEDTTSRLDAAIAKAEGREQEASRG